MASQVESAPGDWLVESAQGAIFALFPVAGIEATGSACHRPEGRDE